MKKQKIKSAGMLFLASIVWGISFVAQSAGMAHVGPLTFTGVRCMLGGIVLLPVLGMRKEKAEYVKSDLWIAGISCGIILFAGTMLQQVGIMTTSVGKSGFLTALYIIIVPFLGIFVHKRPGIKLWISVLAALAGLYLLCMKESLSINRGDALLLAGAFVFSLHILMIDYFSERVPGVEMSCLQFFVCGAAGLIGMFLFEEPRMSDILAAWKPIAYAGAVSCGVGYTLQIVGQKGMNPTTASLILSLESVNAALAGWLLLGQSLSARESAGCVLVFGAIVVAQLPEKK